MMPRNYLIILCLTSGIAFGWLIGFTRPSLAKQQEILENYEWARDGFQMTDEEMAEVWSQIPEFMDSMKRQDEWATVYALRVIALLDMGDAEGAARFMATVAANYHSRFSEGRGDPDLIARIEKMRAEHHVLDAALNEVGDGEGRE